MLEPMSIREFLTGGHESGDRRTGSLFDIEQVKSSTFKELRLGFNLVVKNKCVAFAYIIMAIFGNIDEKTPVTFQREFLRDSNMNLASVTIPLRAPDAFLTEGFNLDRWIVSQRLKGAASIGHYEIEAHENYTILYLYY